MDNVRKRTTTGITHKEEEVVARAVIEWNLNKTIPDRSRAKFTELYTCKYLVSGANHDGYCSGADNEPFESYYLLKPFDPDCDLTADPYYTDSDYDSEDESNPDRVLLEKLSTRDEGCNLNGGYGFCCGEAYVKRKAIEIIPFNHRYLDEMEVSLYACKYCWNDDCSSGECLTSIPPPNG